MLDGQRSDKGAVNVSAGRAYPTNHNYALEHCRLEANDIISPGHCAMCLHIIDAEKLVTRK